MPIALLIPCCFALVLRLVRLAAACACRLLRMSARVPLVSLILIALGGLLSFSIQRSEQRNTTFAMQSWAKSHRYWSNRAAADRPPSPYWRWRAPLQQERLADLGRAEAFEFLQMGAGQEVWAINEAAQWPTEQVPAEVVPLVAMSTASFLGLQLPDDPDGFVALEGQVLGGLEPWRTRLVNACGTCAPDLQPFPSPVTHRVAGSEGLDARGATGIFIAVEQLRRTAAPMAAGAPPMVSMVKRIREGGLPTQQEWGTAGLSGMAALEMARTGERSHADQFLWLAREGPSRTDRIAGLWAAQQVDATDPMLEGIGFGEADR